MEKKPIVFKIPPNSKLKVTFFGPCNEVITNVSIINQLCTLNVKLSRNIQTLRNM